MFTAGYSVTTIQQLLKEEDVIVMKRSLYLLINKFKSHWWVLIICNMKHPYYHFWFVKLLTRSVHQAEVQVTITAKKEQWEMNLYWKSKHTFTMLECILLSCYNSNACIRTQFSYLRLPACTQATDFQVQGVVVIIRHLLMSSKLPYLFA